MSKRESDDAYGNIVAQLGPTCRVIVCADNIHMDCSAEARGLAFASLLHKSGRRHPLCEGVAGLGSSRRPSGALSGCQGRAYGAHRARSRPFWQYPCFPSGNGLHAGSFGRQGGLVRREAAGDNL